MTPAEAADLLRVFGFRPTPEQAADCARAVLLTAQHQHLAMAAIGASRRRMLAAGGLVPLAEWEVAEIKARNARRNRPPAA